MDSHTTTIRSPQMVDVRVCNKMIAKFMGVVVNEYANELGEQKFWMATEGKLSPPFPTSFTSPDDIVYNYHWDWNSLMDVCHKWDNLKVPECHEPAYVDICDWLDNAVSTYEINNAYNQLVNAIEWYESKCKR